MSRFNVIAISAVIFISFSDLAVAKDEAADETRPILGGVIALASISACLTVKGCRRFFRATYDSWNPNPTEHTKMLRKFRELAPFPYSIERGSRLKIREFFDSLSHDQIDDLLNDYRTSLRYFVAKFAGNLSEEQQLRIISSNDRRVIGGLSLNHEALSNAPSEKVLDALEQKGFATSRKNWLDILKERGK